MVATVIVDKHAWHKPRYRQAEHMALQGLPIDCSTRLPIGLAPPQPNCGLGQVPSTVSQSPVYIAPL
jgi:transposase